MSRGAPRRRGWMLALLPLLACGSPAAERAQPAPSAAPAASVPTPAAQPAPPVEELDLPSLVGLTLPEAYERFGAPLEVFSSRGAEPWQDDVVFFYPANLYLFWFQNRVWQVRVDARFIGSFLNLAMGRSREEVLAALAQYYGCPAWLPTNATMPDDLKSRVPADFLKKSVCAPLERKDGTVKVASADVPAESFAVSLYSPGLNFASSVGANAMTMN